MALPSSGIISISDILTEGGVGGSPTAGLEGLVNGDFFDINTNSPSYPDPDPPFAMSDWYGYQQITNTPSLYYWLGDGVNDTLRFTNNSSTLFNSNDDFSYSGWYRIDETFNDTQFLATFAQATPSGSNLIFVMYQKTSARMMLRFRYGGGGNFHQRFWSLYSTNNTSISGITSAGSPNNALVFKGGIDQVSVYDKVLTQTEITDLYNSGVPITCSDAGATSNLLAEYRLENNTTNTSGNFPSLVNTGGTFQLY